MIQNSLDRILEAMARLRILVVGDIMLDRYIFGDAQRISPEAPVPVVEVSRETATLGAAANVALNLHSLGVTVDLWGVLGNDRYGQHVQWLLEQYGIPLLHVPTTTEARTILKTRVVVRNQQLCRLDVEDAPVRYAPKLPITIDWKRYDAVIISDYAKGVVTQALFDELVAQAHCSGKIVAVDPKPKNHIIYHDVDILKPNYSEALELLSLQNIPYKSLCDALFQKFHPKNLVVTLGKEGMLVALSNGTMQKVPSRAREVFDVSGAGDTSIAVLTAAYAAGESIETAAYLANIAAGIVVGKMGTATVTAQELRNENKFESCADLVTP